MSGWGVVLVVVSELEAYLLTWWMWKAPFRSWQRKHVIEKVDERVGSGPGLHAD